MEKESRLIQALMAKYKADKLDAIARFEVYVDNPCGIGEHTQITEEMDKLVTKYIDAKDKMESLKEIENILKP
jgi:hypothetical protein